MPVLVPVLVPGETMHSIRTGETVQARCSQTIVSNERFKRVTQCRLVT
jgi:hypothetical protein